MKPSAAPARLEYILEAIRRIKSYTSGISERTFCEDELTQDAVIRNFKIVGEECQKIEDRYPDAHLASIHEMRNALIRDYVRVDLGIVWKTIETGLSTLEQQIQKFLSPHPVLPPQGGKERTRNFYTNLSDSGRDPLC